MAEGLNCAESLDCNVMVVGMGPVGAVMALALAAEGLDVIVVEPSTEPFDKPRAIGIDADALRLLQRFGLMGEVQTQLGEYRPSEYRSGSGEVLRRILPQPQPHPQAWPPYNTFVQPELEQVLRDACAANPRIDLRLGWIATSFAEAADHAEIEIVPVEGGGAAQTIRGDYIIGCDGARSGVREAMRASIADLEFDEQWLVVDVLVDETVDLPDVTIQYCNGRRPATFIAGPRSLRRWEIMLLPGENGDEMSREGKVWELLAPWMRPEQGQLWRAASYRFHALVVDDWQRDRMFLAGDAAHQTPPFMAQGMNQGFRDVANLAWKLGAVIKSGASPTVLATYTAERQPNVTAVIALTKRLGKIICERDPDRVAERDRVMLEEMATGRGEIVRQDLLPPLLPGQLVMAGDRFGRGAGKTFPQAFVSQGSVAARMDDILGGGFQLFTNTQGVSAALLAGGNSLRIQVVPVGSSAGSESSIIEADGVLQRWFAEHGACAVLVRPDKAVFGTATSPEDIGPLIDALHSALGIERQQAVSAAPAATHFVQQ